jgi:Rieske Fe-S protein
VLEDGETASGETGRTTAHLANALDDRFTVLEKLFGETGARLAAESHGAAIDQIEKNVAAENIACEFRRLDGSVVAKDYTELLTSGDVSSADEIAPGSGAVLRHGLAKVATYRDPEGQLHECSAICPHLGCVVHWNNLESSWDCPCHGSRFDALGHLLMGPANSDLAKA